jgi:hypothetical protein
MGRLIPQMEYRDPEPTYDENGSGEMESYSESFVICTGCGVAVYDVEAHEEHHALLRRLKQLL